MASNTLSLMKKLLNPVGSFFVVLFALYLSLTNLAYADTLFAHDTGDNQLSWSNSAGGVMSVSLNCSSVNGTVTDIEVLVYSNATSDYTLTYPGGSQATQVTGGFTWQTITLASPVVCTSGTFDFDIENVTSDPDEIYWNSSSASPSGYTFTCVGDTVCNNSPLFRILGTPSGGGGGGGGTSGSIVYHEFDDFATILFILFLTGSLFFIKTMVD